MKEFFSKVKEFFKKNWKLVSIISAAAVAVIVTIVLCVCLIPRGKKQLDTPQNVQVVTSTLTWDNVENADNGYTVKIGEDETTAVNSNSLDLTTVISKLVSGENKLYVKANETETYLASEYSAEVIYNYTPAQPEKTAFEKPAVTLDGNTLKWNAVTGATSYTVKIGTTELEPTTATSVDLTTVIDTTVAGEYKLSVKVNATEAHKESAYSDEVTYNYTPAEKPAFDAPVATVTGDTLSWNAVDGATSYTVKIGNTELDPTEATSLDLTTAIDTSVSGNYKVSVKVNATDDHKESAYCTELDYVYTHVNPSFSAPANVAVTQDTLSWDAVSGATSYTVKIVKGDGSAEQTVTDITAASLDLTTVTAKLFTGVNKLYVMANATEGYNASEYSTAEVTYNYTPAADKAAEDYAELVRLIGSITADSDLATATAVKNQIDAAETKYADLSEDAKALAADAKTSFDAKKAAYEEVYNAAANSRNAFVNAVNAAKTEAGKEEDVIALTEKATAANTAYIGLSGLAVSLVTAEEKADYDGVVAALTEWNNAIAAARLIWADVTADTFLAIEGTDAEKVTKAESNIEAAETLIARYSDKKYVQNAYTDNENTVKISDKKAIADSALAAAKTAIDAIVGELKPAVQALTGEIAEENVTKTYYDTLIGYKTVISAFGTYANSEWTDELTAKVDNEIAVLLLIPVAEDSGIFVTGATEGKVTVIYEAYNILEKLIDFKQALPALTLNINGTAVENAVLNVNANGKYTCTAAWTASGEENVVLTVDYKIGGKEEGNAAFAGLDGTKFTDANMWFNPAEYKALDDNGVFTFTSGDAFVDLYLADELVVETDNSLTVSGIPLVTGVPVTSGETTLEAFRAYIARKTEYAFLIDETYEVRFVIYKAEDGERTTLIDHERVSRDTYTLDLTEDDKLERLYIGASGEGVWNEGSPDPGLYEFGGRIDKNKLAAQFNSGGVTADNVYEQLAYEVSVTLEGETKKFVVDCPQNYSIPSAILKLNIYNLFKNETATGYSIVVRIVLKDGSEYSHILKESNPITAVDWNYTATFADTQLSINLGPDSDVKIADLSKAPEGNLKYGAWQVANKENGGSAYQHEYHDGLALLVYEVTEDIANPGSYDFVAENAVPFIVYTHTAFSDISWATVNGEIEKVWRKLPAEQKTDSKQFVFALQVIANETGIEAGFADSVPVYLTNADGSEHAAVTYTVDFRLEAKGLNETVKANSNTGEIIYGMWQLANDEGKEDVHKEYLHDYHDGLALVIYEVTEEITNPESYDFEAANAQPFAIYTHRAFSYIQWTDVNAYIESVWEKLPAAQRNNQKKFVFALQVIANEAALEEGYENSAPLYLTTDDGNHSVLTYNMDFTVPNALQIGLDANKNVIFLQGFTVEKAMLAGYVSHVEIRFANKENPEEYATAYIVYDAENEKMLLRKGLEDAENEKILVHGESEYWTGASEVNALLKGLITDAETAKNFDILQSGWYFQTKVVVNEAADYYTSGDGVSNGWTALVTA